MRIIYAGTPEFAVAGLDALLAHGYDIIAVYTQPDRPAGRGRKLTPSPVKQRALEHNIPVYQPASLKGEAEQAARQLAVLGLLALDEHEYVRCVNPVDPDQRYLKDASCDGRLLHNLAPNRPYTTCFNTFRNLAVEFIPQIARPPSH